MLTVDLCERLDALHLKRMRINTIKEKFGTLRVYLFNANDAADDLVRQAEERAGTVCEWCGARGQTYHDRWMRTLCGICNARYLKGQAQYD